MGEWRNGCFNDKRVGSLERARGVVVSHPLSMREALGSIPSVSIFRLNAMEGTENEMAAQLK